jgi:hypothetical protein
MTFTIDVLDIVCSKPGGVWLSDDPIDGMYLQRLKNTAVFRGEGVVYAVHDIIIDYDTWAPEYEGTGKLPYRSCLVVARNGAVGWAGEGALVKVR